MTTRSDVELGTTDGRVVIACDWQGYEIQLALRGERSRPKLAFLDGELEITSPSPDHERIKSRIGMIIEAYLLYAKLAGGPGGSPTLRRSRDLAGVEPDESYSFGDDAEGPDLVIEVNWTRGGIDKLEIYRRLGIREVWFWEANQITVHVRQGDRFAVQPRSSLLPGLDLGLVIRLLDLRGVVELHAAMREALGLS